MSLSDELLRNRDRLRRARKELSRLRESIDARACFLVDEEGAPFAAVGNVEFQYPHPLSGLMKETSGASILEALVGEKSQRGDGSSLVVRRVSRRALLVVVLPGPVSPDAESDVTRRLVTSVEELHSLLGSPFRQR